MPRKGHFPTFAFPFNNKIIDLILSLSGEMCNPICHFTQYIAHNGHDKHHVINGTSAQKLCKIITIWHDHSKCVLLHGADQRQLKTMV